MLGRDTQKEIFVKDYKNVRKVAEKHRERGNRERAATHYRKASRLLREIADLETNEALRSERLELADNLEEAAEALSQTQQALDQDAASDDSGGSGRGRRGRDGSGGGGGGRSPGGDEEEIDAEEYLEDPPDMDFGDVGGMTELKETLRDKVIDPLERPELYEEYDLGVVNGVLLHGPPGTGKTYITKALAGELAYNYIEAQASDITSSLVGEAADNMAELFQVARDNQPCMLFLDEIEAIAAERSGGSRKSMSESQMITQFLTEMSNTKGEDVVVVSATNLPDDIDGAAWRRFDERIDVPPPDATARAAVLRVHLRDRPVLTDQIDWERIKELTEGYVSSDLEIIASTAAREALKDARQSKEVVPITQEHIEAAIEETPSSLEAWDGGTGAEE